LVQAGIEDENLKKLLQALPDWPGKMSFKCALLFF
jgi:hypothetical protein